MDFFYYIDQTRLNLAWLITSIAGTIISGVATFIQESMTKYKDERNSAHKAMRDQQLHMNDLNTLLFHLVEFLNAKKIEKVETFKKCLEHLRALPATFNRKIDAGTREELISCMIEFLHADHPLVAQIKELCQMAEDLKTVTKEEDSKESPKEHTSHLPKEKTPPHSNIETKEREQVIVAIDRNSAAGRPVRWHGELESATRQPVGAGYESGESLVSKLRIGSIQAKEYRFKQAYKHLLDALNIGHLKYFRYQGKTAESPLEPNDLSPNFVRPSPLVAGTIKKWKWKPFS